MACACPRISEDVVNGRKVPLVRPVGERQHEDAVGAATPFAVGPWGAGSIQVRPAGAGNKFADAVRVGAPIGVLGREDLVDMVVAVEHHVRAELHQG